MSPPARALEVVQAGWSTSVQDLGRFGLSHLGLGAAGTVDPVGMARLNHAVGNAPEAAIIESGGGLVLRAVRPVTLIASPWSAPVSFSTGETIEISPATDRRWTQIAVAGGVLGTPILGSLAADSMAKIEPVRIMEGTSIDVGSTVLHSPVDLTADTRSTSVVRLWPGPRGDFLRGDAMTQLCSAAFTIGEGSRVGVRLSGRSLERADRGELPSEGMIAGAIQVPHDGSPIVMGPDHPVTGGYPVVAVVDPNDLWVILTAQAGTTIRFRPLEQTGYFG